MDIWDKFRKLAKKNDIIKANDRIIIAVSGGPDSVCLLHLFWRLKKNLPLDINIAHVNHGLRKESKKDLDFVNKLGEKLNLPVHSCKVDLKSYIKTNKVSIETAGRVLRYEYFVDLATYS